MVQTAKNVTKGGGKNKAVVVPAKAPTIRKKSTLSMKKTPRKGTRSSRRLSLQAPEFGTKELEAQEQARLNELRLRRGVQEIVNATFANLEDDDDDDDTPTPDWTCKCGGVNEHDESFCSACEEPRSLPKTGFAGWEGTFIAKFKQVALENWKCTTCTLSNPKSNSKCAVCDTACPKDASSASM